MTSVSVIARLLWEFLKIGLFSVGGGMATLPFLYDLSDRTGWFSHTELTDMLAVSEATPGPIGINMATYAGFHVAGIPGAIAASLGLVLPGLILTLVVSAILIKFRNNRYIEGIFYGLRPASTALIAAAGLMVAAITFLDLSSISGNFTLLSTIKIPQIILGAILIIATRWVPVVRDLHPVVFIAFAAICGMIFAF